MQVVCRICGVSHARTGACPGRVGARNEGSVLFDLARLGARDRRSLVAGPGAGAAPRAVSRVEPPEEEPALVYAAPLPLLGATPLRGRWLLPLLLGAFGAGCVAAITALVLVLASPGPPVRRAPARPVPPPAAPAPAPRRGPPPELEEQLARVEAPRPAVAKARRHRRLRPRPAVKSPPAAPARAPAPVQPVDPLDRLIDEALRKKGG